MLNVTRLLTYLRPYRLQFAASVVASALASALDGLTFALFIPFFRVLFGNASPLPATPTAVERITSTVINAAGPVQASIGSLYTIVLLIALAVVLKNVTGYIASYLAISIEERVTRDVRVELYEALQTIRVTALKQMRAGDIVSRAIADIDQIKALINDGLQTVLRNGILILVYIAILFGLDWRLTGVTLLLAAAIATAMTPLLTRIRALFRQVFTGRGDVSAHLVESVTGAHVVRAHGAERDERRRFRRKLDRVMHDRLHAERYALVASPLSEVLGVGVFVALLVLGMSVAAFDNVVRPEVFIGFTAVTLRLLSPLKKLAHFPTIAEQAGAAAERVFEVLDDRRRERRMAGGRSVGRLERGFEFADVWFAYEADHWVLRGVQLQVAVGEVVAIVGPTGAGKSTLVDLLPRFIEPSRGTVLVDGLPVADYDLDSLRRAMAIVSQDTILFNDTIRANIAYGDRKLATDDDIERAARAANAHGFIGALPDGYETIVGDRGVRLSGGERQRIAIARALLRNAPILILDEATSALDTESDRLVQEAIARLMQDRTVLVIAHRLETIARADRIVVLDHGRIVETGRHDELLAAGGLYQHLSEVAQAGVRGSLSE